MRSKPDKQKCIIAGLLIDEHKIRTDVAVAAILPLTGQWMVAVVWRQRLIPNKQLDDWLQILLKPATKLTRSNAFEVALKLSRHQDRPHVAMP